MRGSTIHAPLLGEKLDFMCKLLGKKQKNIALELNLTTSAISKWRSENYVPGDKAPVLCKLLGGISIKELELGDIADFEKAVRKYFCDNIGNIWKAFAKNRGTLYYLSFEIISTQKCTGLKGIYKKPQEKISSTVPRVSIGSTIRFKLKVHQFQPITMLLIVETPKDIQLLVPDNIGERKKEQAGYYFFPDLDEDPLHVGKSMGPHKAHLLSLFEQPTESLRQIMATRADGYAADELAKWLIEYKIVHQINTLNFLVNA